MPSFADSCEDWPLCFNLDNLNPPLSGPTLFKWVAFGYLNGASVGELADLIRIDAGEIEEIYMKLAANKSRFYSYSIADGEYRYLNGKRRLSEIAAAAEEPKCKAVKLFDDRELQLERKIRDLVDIDGSKGWFRNKISVAAAAEN